MSVDTARRELLALIGEAASRGDLATIEKLIVIDKALNQKPSSPVEVHFENKPTKQSQSSYLSPKAKGKEVRAQWFERVAGAGISLNHLRGRIYETSRKERVGIAYANEHMKRPDKWWLGLRDETYSVVVLLCRDCAGKILDFVVPSTVLSPFWKVLSRHGGQVEFHVERTGGNYAFRIPGGRSISLNSYLSQYSSLR